VRRARRVHLALPARKATPVRLVPRVRLVRPVLPARREIPVPPVRLDPQGLRALPPRRHKRRFILRGPATGGAFFIAVMIFVDAA
jgi:hypothetical protein